LPERQHPGLEAAQQEPQRKAALGRRPTQNLLAVVRAAELPAGAAASETPQNLANDKAFDQNAGPQPLQMVKQ